MAEARKVRLYIYNGTSKGSGLSLTKSETFTLDDRKKVVVSDPKETIDPSTGVKTTTKITTTTVYSYEVTLSKLEYRKKVYEPCQIMANLLIGVVQERTDVKTDVLVTYTDGKTNTDSKIDEGHFKPVEMIGNDKINLIKGSFVELEIDDNTIAKNYYVHKVRSLYKTVSGKTSLFVELTIYSRDKLMTLDKYSRAYTAKRLYTDILSEEAQKFSSVEVVNHMQLLKYQDPSTQVTARDELRIPYLVQYNESFYQFMVRSANRFGEFLYFEDGKLNLGMQPSEKNYYSDDDVIDWATKPNAVQNRYYESAISEGTSVEERSYSYMTHKPDENDAYADSADNRYNIDPTSAGEWSDQELEKNKYIEFEEALLEEVKCYVLEALFRGFEATTVGEAITAIVMRLGKMIYDVHRNNKDYNNLIDYANFQEKDEDDNFIVCDDQKSDDKYKQFVTYSGSDNLSSNLISLFKESGITNFTDLFYQIVRKKEKEVGEQTVWLDFGNYYYPIKLGDKLNVDKKDYVVISVEGSYENGQEHLLVSAVPVFSLTETDPVKQTSTTAGDPWTASCPFPPALPDVVIRDARPQVAFVADFLDPENLSRIRVRYPWQDADGDMSPWIRVTLPLATTGGSVNFTPSIGDEVMVGYVHGNIEHPYGMGYLTAPFVNERWKNAIPFDQYGGLHGIQVKTGHHLKFTDGANAANLVASLFGPFNIAKSFWPTGAVGAWPMGDEKSSDFGGGFELSDRYGFYKIKGSTDDRNITIESPVGTVNMKAFQGISIEAPNGEIEIKGKNVSIEASNRMTIKSGENIEDKLWYRKQWKDNKVKALGLSLWSETQGALMTVKSNIWDQVFDVSFLRCLVEWFLIPVNGTLKIKSATFVTIEAGEGNVEVPQVSMRYGKGLKNRNGLEDISKVIQTTKCIKPIVSAIVENIHVKYNALCEATLGFNRYSKNLNINEQIISYNTIVSKGSDPFVDDEDGFNWDATNLKYEVNEDAGEKPTIENYKEETNPQTAYEKALMEWLRKTNIPNRNRMRYAFRFDFFEMAQKLRSAAQDLVDAVAKLTGCSKDNIILQEFDLPKDVKKENLDLEDVATAIQGLTIPTNQTIISLDDMTSHGYNSEITKVSDAIWDNVKTAMVRYVVYKYISGRNFLDQDKTKISSVDDSFSNEKWGNYVKSVEPNSTMDKYGKNKANELINPLCGIVDDHFQWTHGFKGKILMSDEAEKTSFFGDNQQIMSYTNRTPFKSDIKTLRKLLQKM